MRVTLKFADEKNGEKDLYHCFLVALSCTRISGFLCRYSIGRHNDGNRTTWVFIGIHLQILIMRRYSVSIL
jgi:hypothetical protein